MGLFFLPWILLLIFSLSFLFDTPLYIFFGWLWGLYRIVIRLIDEPAVIGISILVFLLLPIVFHLFVAQIAKRRNKQWTFKKSFVASSLILLIIVAGFFTVGGIHEIVLPKFSKESRYMYAYTGMDIPPSMNSSNKLRQLCIGIMVHIDMNNERLPSGGTILDNGQLGHGWITQILPYIKEQELYKKIDFSKSWNDPVNAPVFRERVKFCESPYLTPLAESRRIDRNGFFKTDYAANQLVLPIGKPLRFADIQDGSANTILAGEVVHNLRAWGSPLNARDPKLGINKSPYGFGSNNTKSITFVLVDGSTKYINKNIDPKILEAYATPDGGEEVVIE
jgi:hypothetical protein